VAYLTDKLSLTSADAEKFWPVYDEFQDKKDALQKAYRQKVKIVKEQTAANLTDAQADDVISANLQQDQDMLDLKKEYVISIPYLTSFKIYYSKKARFNAGSNIPVYILAQFSNNKTYSSNKRRKDGKLDWHDFQLSINNSKLKSPNIVIPNPVNVYYKKLLIFNFFLIRVITTITPFCINHQRQFRHLRFF